MPLPLLALPLRHSGSCVLRNTYVLQDEGRKRQNAVDNGINRKASSKKQV